MDKKMWLIMGILIFFSISIGVLTLVGRYQEKKTISVEGLTEELQPKQRESATISKAVSREKNETEREVEIERTIGMQEFEDFADVPLLR